MNFSDSGTAAVVLLRLNSPEFYFAETAHYAESNSIAFGWLPLGSAKTSQ
jgi:hypothetical protein